MDNSATPANLSHTVPNFLRLANQSVLTALTFSSCSPLCSSFAQLLLQFGTLCCLTFQIAFLLVSICLQLAAFRSHMSRTNFSDPSTYD